MRLTRTPLAIAAALLAGNASAFQFDTPDDWSVRWDNTFKLSTKIRTAKPDPVLNESFTTLAPGVTFPQALNFNAGDQNFQKRGIVSERFDLLSEFDVAWRRDFGLRVSGAGWYDQKLHEKTKATDGFIGQSPVDEFPSTTKSRAGGKGDLLDAFIFGGWRFDNQMKLTGRLGRHALQYGESLFFGDNGIARAQGPIDIEKLLASPGAQFKEIIRPVSQVSMQLQVNSDVSIGGYYQFNWEADRVPPGGSYFSNANIPWGSPYPQFLSLGANYTLAPGADQKPKDSGQFGLQLKWRIRSLDLGFYLARFHDKDGQSYGVLNPASVVTVPGVGDFGQGEWYYKYGTGVKTAGASASYSVGDFNFAAEASVRMNMPLRNTQMIYFTGGTPPRMATGKTAHLNFSWLASLGQTFISQEAGLLGELAWNRVLSYDDPGHNLDGGRSRDATAIRLSFSPTYRQVVPGLDLSVPIGLGYTLQGYSAVTAWGPRNTGDLSVGLDGSYDGVWQFGLSYTKYLGSSIPFVDYRPLLSGGNPIFGHGNSLGDRDFVALSLRRTF